MADSDDDRAYALDTPDVRQRDTIARPLQREILGEEAADDSKNATPDELTTPSKKKVNEEKASQKDKTLLAEEDEGMSTPPSGHRRRTLSPSKAEALLADLNTLDAAVSRQDTVSPEALKAVLQAAATEAEDASSKEMEVSPAQSKRSQWKSQEEADTNSSVDDAPQKEWREFTTLGLDTSDSFTDSMFAPNLLEKDAVRRATLDPTEAASVVAALQLEARSLTSSSEQTQVTTIAITTGIDTEQTAQAKQVEVNDKEASDQRKSSPAPKKAPPVAKKTPSAAKKNSPEPKKASPTRSSTRRATVDPSDVLFMLNDSLLEQESRRQTIDESGLLELNSALESPADGNTDSTRKRRKESVRTQGQDKKSQMINREKRARVSLSRDDDNREESKGVDSSPHQENDGCMKYGRKQTRSNPSSGSPSSTDRQEANDNNQDAHISEGNLPIDRIPTKIPKPSLFSPPPGGKSPLKGILSARKAKKATGGGVVQTTPNKSVNFGPSQGAEFNHGSPSTSMTPMCAKDALRFFPLESPASEEEPDDEETFLNSSILGEADSVDEGAKEKNDHVGKPSKIPVFSSLERRNSFLPPKSTDRRRRRHSLRGYSPLDSQAEVRQRRRRTINIARQSSTLSSSIATDDAAGAASSQPPLSARNNSFLSTTDLTQSRRMPYADSSASSDAGEDMEITGDYSNQFTVLARESVDASGKRLSIAPTNLPRDDDTTEFNTAEFSLGHLLAESAVYELTKSEPEPELSESLAYLSNEDADLPSSPFKDASRRLHSQDNTLDPIVEENEGGASSHQSLMSLEFSDESDTEANRESLAVNLSSKFERVSTDGDHYQESEQSRNSKSLSVSEVPPVRLIVMQELLSTIDINGEVALEEAYDFSFEAETDRTVHHLLNDVKVACAYETCSEVIERHSQDISTWSSGLSEELASLLQVKVSSLFSPENLDDVGHQVVRELYGIETIVARSGWCQFRADMEKQLTSSLSSSANSLANDVKALKISVSADNLKRQNDLVEMQEMIAREEQIGVLLDAIEEQQGAQDEYVSAVKDLETQCSSLLLEESVLQSRLNVLEGRAAELEPVTPETSSRLEQQVLATEELLAIQDSFSVWKLQEATSSLLRLSCRFEDALFDVEISVEVRLDSCSTGGAETLIKANETLKRGKRNTYLPMANDVVLILQRLLLDPLHISRIGDGSEHLENGSDGSMCSKLQVLENFLSRSFRLLEELRELSTHYSTSFDENDSTLWIDFLKFPSAVLRNDMESVRFSVGFSMVPIFPYTDFQTVVRVTHGQVSAELLSKKIDEVARQSPKYFTRVCRRLHESFMR